MILQLFLVIMITIADINAVDIDYDELMMDNTDEYIDPNDMLTFYTSIKREIISDDLDEKLYLEDGCGLHKGKISSLSRQVLECSSKLSTANVLLKQTVETVNTLQGNNTRKSDAAVNSFYLRLLKSFWNILQMEELETLLSDGEKKIEMLRVSVSLEDIKTFKMLFNESMKHSEIDEFFYTNFEKIIPQDNTPLSVYLEKEWLQPLANVQLWLCCLGCLVLILSFWAFSLCVLDVQRNMRWTRVIGMIFFLLFVISCIEQWKIMVKNLEAKKRSEETMVGPENCMVPPSFWDSIVAYWTKETKCEKYHRHIMLEASEEVTPMKAITETISLMIFEPLQLLGTFVGRFFNNFYTNVDLLWAIPATLLFCFIFTAILFVSFGYGIELPFWMGGIRPTSRFRTDEKQLNQILVENRKQLREEQNTLLREAKDMLRDISIAAISHTQRTQNEAVALQPFFANSAGIIERQLEQIVSKRFNSQLEKNVNEISSPDAVDYGGITDSVIVPKGYDDRQQDEFVTKVKTILEDSLNSDGTISPARRASDFSESEPAHGFLEEVRQVMTP